MAAESGLTTFVLDWNLSSPKIEKALHFAGAKHVPALGVRVCRSLFKQKAHDVDIVKKCGSSGLVFLTGDQSMISEHDIARVAEEAGATVFIVHQSVQRMRRWDFLLWLVTYLPRLAHAADAFETGSAWRVSRDGRLSRIKSYERPKTRPAEQPPVKHAKARPERKERKGPKALAADGKLFDT